VTSCAASAPAVPWDAAPAPGTETTSLTVAGCRTRQERLRRELVAMGMRSALLRDRRHVHYATGFWCREAYRPLAIVAVDAPTILVAPYEPGSPVAADEVRAYASAAHGTLVDDQAAAARRDAEPCDADDDAPPVADALRRLRRRKDDDEIAVLRAGFAAAEEAYAVARAALVPGLDEVELYAAMQAAAVRRVGEMIGEFGNDFQIGGTGSAPRRRRCQAGESAVLDVSVVVRGYASDMCRTFVVGGETSAAQREAHARVLAAIDDAVALIRPGVACAAVDAAIRPRLAGWRGLAFPHHLGHGIGLAPHEAPRVVPGSADVFAIGDVFTLEPGLYGPALRAGVRVEQAYRLDAAGPVPLTRFATDLG